MSISTSIKVGLARSSLTQAKLASSIGVSRETVSVWCNDHNMPNYSLVVAMAELFGVSVSDFIRWGE